MRTYAVKVIKNEIFNIYPTITFRILRKYLNGHGTVGTIQYTSSDFLFIVFIMFTLFRDMVVTCQGRDLAANLVDCLVQRYLGDSASTDAIR
jgi:hypothetical protein